MSTSVKHFKSRWKCHSITSTFLTLNFGDSTIPFSSLPICNFIFTLSRYSNRWKLLVAYFSKHTHTHIESTTKWHDYKHEDNNELLNNFATANVNFRLTQWMQWLKLKSKIAKVALLFNRHPSPIATYLLLFKHRKHIMSLVRVCVSHFAPVYRKS